MSRRGIAAETLVELVLLAVVLLSLGVFIGASIYRGAPLASIEACRDSVILTSKSAQFVGTPACATIYPGVLSVDDSASIDAQQRQLAAQVARMMGDCWYEFGEGKESPWRGEYLSSRESICFVCHSFSMPKSMSLRDDFFQVYASDAKYTAFGRSQSYADFLASGILRFPLPGTPSTYLPSYFMDRVSGGRVLQFVGEDGSIPESALEQMRKDVLVQRRVLESGKDYAVVFWNTPDDRISQQVSALTGGAASRSLLFVAPDDKVGESCQLVYRTARKAV